MFSITKHRTYIAAFAGITLFFVYQGLVHSYSAPDEATWYALYALLTGALFCYTLQRWFRLEYLWARAMALLVPQHAQDNYRNVVHTSLNDVLSKQAFRHGLKKALNRPDAFKLYLKNATPTMELDIVLPTAWRNHNYLHAALGWIATCMPSNVRCLTSECSGTRLVLRFVCINADPNAPSNTDALRHALRQWKQSIQCVLVIRLPLCDAQELKIAPARMPGKAIQEVPPAPNGVFNTCVALNQERLALHIGFDGSSYYTYFEDAQYCQHGHRKYPSWAALWHVWKHIREVRNRFAALPSKTSGP